MTDARFQDFGNRRKHARSGRIASLPFPGLHREKRLRGREAHALNIFLSFIFLSSRPIVPDTLDSKILARKISNPRHPWILKRGARGERRGESRSLRAYRELRV